MGQGDKGDWCKGRINPRSNDVRLPRNHIRGSHFTVVAQARRVVGEHYLVGMVLAKTGIDSNLQNTVKTKGKQVSLLAILETIQVSLE